MKQYIKIFALLIPLLFLSGCKEAGIGSKNLLRAVYFEKEQSVYEARLICFQGAPSADAGEVQETALVMKGQGTTVFSALQEARHDQEGELFYGQSELLLIGPNLAASTPFEVIQFMSQQDGGRPNTGVYLVNMRLADLTKCEHLDRLIDSIETLREQGNYQVPLYRLQNQEDALLPILNLDIEDQSASFYGTALYADQKYLSSFNQAQTQLCALLSGQVHKAQFTKNGSNPIHFFVDSANIGYQVQEGKNGPVLHITLQGNIRELQTMRGSEDACSKVCTDQLNKWLEGQVLQILDRTFNGGIDVLHLRNRLKLYDARRIDLLESSNTLFTPNRIQFHSKLTAL